MKRRIQITLTVMVLTLSLLLAGVSLFDGIRAAVAAKRAAAFAMITVDSAADGTLAALAGNGTCDLREAIAAANTNAAVGQCVAGTAGADTITFAPNVTGTITLTAGELALYEDVTIQGPGARMLTVSGGNVSRVIYVDFDVTASINDLTMANGNGVGEGNGEFFDFGGGIFNVGVLTLNRCTVSGNTADSGGGILNSHILTLRECTISGNTATSLDTGGGIRSFYGTLYVINSTISGNRANDSGGFNGGGIWTFGPATIINSTITNNQAAGDESAGGIHRDSGDFIIKNSIIAGNTGTGGATADVAESPLYDGAFVTQGYNLIGKNNGAAAVFPAGNPNANRDIVGTSATPINPLLGSLQNNGGPTNTHQLLTGSPAIDKGAAATDPDTSAAITTDQRGSHRPADNPAIANATLGNGSDIGAYEIGCQPITATMGGGGTICPSGAANVTVTVSGGVAPYTVQLSNGAMQTGNGPVFTFLVSPASTTIYTVASGNADGSGCPITGSGSATVTVLSSPSTPSITPGGSTTICTGGSVTLTSSSASGNQWFRNGNLIGGATNQTYMATAAGDYTVVVTANGCPSAPSTALTVTVNPPPTTANAGMDRRIVPGGAVTLAANTPSIGTGAWSVVSGPSLLPSQFSSTTAPAATFTPAGGVGAYLLRWTISNAPCAPSSDDVLITVDSNPLITVTSTLDGALEALVGNGTCELREAIAAANTDVPVGECAEGIAGTDTITFAPNVTGTITLTAGTLTIRKSVTIQGPGARVLTVSGNNAARILSFFADGPVTINDLTMANGNGVNPSGNNSGGAIYNRGTLTLNRSVVADSTANQYGGGIFNEDGLLTVRESTISGNTANGNNTGGGITNWGTLVVINSTISGNRANSGGSGNGGGIHSIDFITIINSTITNNQAAGGNSAGGIRRVGADLTIKNTIVAGNTGTGGATADLNEAGNLIGGFATQGYNLIGQRDGARSFPAGNPNTNQDIVGTSGAPINPLLGALADNGGPTDTHLLLPNSPAIDKGAAATDPVASAALTTDQRGFQRPLDTALANAASGNGSDIGAVEGVFIAPTIIPNGIMLRQGSLAGALQIATASDADDVANTLQIQISSNGGATYGNSATLNGVTVTLTDSNMGGAGINPDALGQVFADVTAACTASNATFKLRVTDGGGLTDAQDFTVTVTPNTAPTLGTYAATTLDYNAGTTVTPNAPPADSGAVMLTVSAPGWLGTLSINQTSGAVTFGNAQPPGTYTVTVTATDSCQAVTQQSFMVVVNCPAIAVTNPAVTTGTTGVAFSQTFTQTGGAGTTNFSTTSTLPNGLTLLSGGTLSGTPEQPGTFPIVVKATDSNGCMGTSATYNLVINCSTLNLVPASIANGQVGTPYSQQFSVTGSFGNSTAFTVSMGVLPAGLSLSSAGLLSGTPTAPFNGSFKIKAQDSFGCFGEQMYTLTIGCNTLSISPNTLPPVQANFAFSQQLSANGVAPRTFTLSAVPTPPSWLTITADGLLTGIPPTIGNFDFTVNVVDGNSCPGSQSYSLTVICPSVTIAPLPPAIAGSAYNGNLNAIPAGTYQFSSTNKPAWLTIAGNGEMTGTPTSAGTFHFDVTVTGPGTCAKTVAVALTVICPAIAVTPASLPNASVGAPYNQTLGATPGGTTYKFAVTAGLLPPGLTLNGNGSFSGTPAQSGTFNFRITATGFSAGFGGCSGFQDYTLTVTCSGINLAPASLPGGTVGTAYNQTLNVPTASGYSYSVTSGALPTGLTLNAATGNINGTPTTSGSFTFTVTASQGACSSSQSYTVAIACAALTFTTTSLPAGAAGNAYAETIAVTPAGSYSFSLAQGNLPSGLTLHPTTGILSGLPSVSGSYNFAVRATAPNGCKTTQSLTLQINCPTITLSALADPFLNSPYNQTVTASPSGGNYSFAVTAGALPTGLLLNAATGAISGTPTAAGSYNFTITATGFGSCTGSRNYTDTIAGSGCPTITLSDLPGGQPGQLYNQSATATPAGSYSYAVTSGSLPPGMTLYGSLGMLFGYPNTAGTFNFTITATNSSNCTGSKAYSVQIGGAAMQSLIFGDFDGDGKADLSVWRGQAGDWLTVNSGDGKLKTEAWGSSAAPYFDVMTPGDYDGDGRMDLAVFRRQTGEWLIKGSRDGAVTAQAWGMATDVPVPGDYDGDSKTDIAVWRGSDTNWYILRSSDGQTETVSWGTSRAPYRDVPVSADFDGDGKTDIAVFRQQNGHWYIKLSSDGSTLDKAWGLGSDVPVAADYDGDGKADIAVWRGAEANWYILRSSDGATQSVSWGTATLQDVPVPGDYDGDGRADVSVWRESVGAWYIKGSRDGSPLTKVHGQSGDVPIPTKQK